MGGILSIVIINLKILSAINDIILNLYFLKYITNDQEN